MAQPARAAGQDREAFAGLGLPTSGYRSLEHARAPPGFMPATLLCFSARPMRFAGGPAVLCALAAVALALALQISNGMFDERALALATLAGAVSVVAALWLRHGASPSEAPLGAQAILGAGCAWGLASQLLGN